MAGESTPITKNADSAANLMVEALDRASSELDGILKACVSQLTTSGQALQKLLSTELQKVVEQAKCFVDANIEDVSAHQEELLTKLEELEANEIDTVRKASRELREQVTAQGQAAKEAISKLVEDQLTQLITLRPEVRFNESTKRGLDDLGRLTTDSMQRIESNEVDAEKVLVDKATELDAALQAVIADTRRSIEQAIENYSQEMEQKISTVVTQLSELASETLKDLEKRVRVGAKTVQNAGSASKARLTEQLEEWHNQCSGLSNSFKITVTLESQNAQQLHCAKLDHKVNDVKDEIHRISSDAQSKISSSHKLFLSSLKRLENKYNDRLAKLMARFENALAEEARLNPSSTIGSNEWRDVLKARLETSSAELSKAFQRQIDQLRTEYARGSSGSSERLEQIRRKAVEGLDQNSEKFKTELASLSGEFNFELTKLTEQLPEIEALGGAKAQRIVAYRSTMLQFEQD